jgi:hypothetical protein
MAPVPLCPPIRHLGGQTMAPAPLCPPIPHFGGQMILKKRNNFKKEKNLH